MEYKKTRKADLTNKKSFFFAIGLFISFGLTLIAFEWKKHDVGELMDLGLLSDAFEELMEIPPTEQLQTPPPIQQPQIREVPDDVEILEELDFELDVEITEDKVIKDIIFEDELDEEVTDDIMFIVEEQAAFPGGDNAWSKYLRKHLKYPRSAMRMGIEGRIILSFVVDLQGNISDIKVVRGIGGGCDEEAKRVLSNSPRWSPGKQRGRAVKSRMSIQFRFNLK